MGKKYPEFFFLLTVLSIDIYLFIYYSINDRGREKKKRDELIQKEKNTLYSSLKEFKDPLLIFATKSFRVRIDQLGNETYRYASWPVKKDMSQKPDLILYSNTIGYSGSCGNHEFVFKNGAYIYRCFNFICFGDTPVVLAVEQNGREVLNQAAIEIMR